MTQDERIAHLSELVVKHWEAEKAMYQRLVDVEAELDALKIEARFKDNALKQAASTLAMVTPYPFKTIRMIDAALPQTDGQRR